MVLLSDSVNPDEKRAAMIVLLGHMRRLREARGERAEAGSDLASFESLFVRRECPHDRVRASFVRICVIHTLHGLHTIHMHAQCMMCTVHVGR